MFTSTHDVCIRRLEKDIHNLPNHNTWNGIQKENSGRPQRYSVVILRGPISRMMQSIRAYSAY